MGTYVGGCCVLCSRAVLVVWSTTQLSHYVQVYALAPLHGRWCRLTAAGAVCTHAERDSVAHIESCSGFSTLGLARMSLLMSIPPPLSRFCRRCSPPAAPSTSARRGCAGGGAPTALAGRGRQRRLRPSACGRARPTASPHRLRSSGPNCRQE